MKFLGIDGCRAGWFLVGLNAEGQSACHLLSHIVELDAYLAFADLVLIDIPIGLHTRHPHERLCDRQARHALQPKRGASIFPAPSRCALSCETYVAACQRNKACTGRGLSKQSYAILPKIREVDDYLKNRQRRSKIHEMHPEVCFWALNDQTAMQYNKKTSEGYAERVALLNRYLPSAKDTIEQALQQSRRADVARDDIVDALAGAVTARRAQALRSFPDNPEHDELGLPMEIVY